MKLLIPFAFLLTSPAFADVPVARDVLFQGTMQLQVDLRDVKQGIFRIHQTIPVSGPGPMVLLYPKWKPGNHSPSGQIENLAGLKLSAGGKPVTWRRDPIDMFAFHVDVPAGATEIEAEFQYLSPQKGGAGGRRVFGPSMANLQWESVSLYPAGYYVHNVPVRASATYPAGWTGFTALRGQQRGTTVTYDQVPYDILVDSPVYAGAYTKQVQLDPQVTFDIVADSPWQTAITPEQVALHKTLVQQADKLFGTRHYDHYDFLVALSDYQSGDGLEHHRSSENTLDADLLTDWDANLYDHYVVAHEYTHSWNGKFRRPADLWTPDYNQPMRDSLLWVYEGQTQFWGDVLSARSGLWSKQAYLDFLANVVARYSEGMPGVTWRPVQDTTSQPIITDHGPGGAWPSWFRSADYYRNGELFWIEADATIRKLTNGKKSMDDFAKLFFGVEPGQWDHELTYRFDDVAAALNQIAPYDWAGFLRSRLDSTDPAINRRTVEAAGYRLVFGDKPTDSSKKQLAKAKVDDFYYSVGLNLSKQGEIKDVLWDGPAFRAGIRPTETVLAVNDAAYDADAMARAITDAKRGAGPIRLVVKSDDRYRDVTIDYRGGLRYPRLEKIGTGEGALDRLLAPR
ncbi:peptidase M61 family protein [Sphingomonas changbaiensis NBRC 104936]|uniref:Peptidase M61 family protein n=1 Tax=Sphingomonas changbaiensis NBRC 104936 TaxID=1219043 RepID=A0A0E9MQK3_9SPHN|nr:M61 family metallopeptidase [Sphingomonas changbaiensis]GAO39834.1 peptidase M61 family protein [Sphingomonas changbaiensis NBRC 104936]